MKKILLSALICAAMVPLGKAQETIYVVDPSQGYLFNRFANNWFLQLEVGGNLLMTPHDTEESFAKRIQPQFELNVGKWFSPIMGLRASMGAVRYKGATLPNSLYAIDSRACGDARFAHEVFYKLNGGVDVMLSLTNWWRGYRPDRVYNAVLYGGFMVNVPYYHDDDGFHRRGNVNLGLRVGMLNTFVVSPKIDLLIDVRYGADEMRNEGKNVSHSLAVLVGAAYKFGNSRWNAPLVPLSAVYKYSDDEGDALVRRLEAADARIASLERKLREKRGTAEVVEIVSGDCDDAPVATIYFPIGSSTIDGVELKVVKAVANAIQSTSDNYVITGWADNYTGSPKVNERLRNDRAEAVRSILVKCGVDASRLEIESNDDDLTDYGAGSAPLSRAVTISTAQ